MSAGQKRPRKEPIPDKAAAEPPTKKPTVPAAASTAASSSASATAEADSTEKKNVSLPIDRVKELLLCPISTDPMTVPILLPCQHVFDYTSIIGVHEAAAVTKKTPVCPLCRFPLKPDHQTYDISLVHSQLYAIVYPDQKIDPKTPRPLKSKSVAQFDTIAGGATSASSAAAASLTVDDLRQKIAIKSVVYHREVELLRQWAKSVIEEKLMIHISSFIDTSPAAPRYSIKKIFPFNFLLTPAHHAALRDAFRVKFPGVTKSTAVWFSASNPRSVEFEFELEA